MPILLSLINAIMIPLEIGYGLPRKLLLMDGYWQNTMDFLYLLDNILMFFTTYPNKQGYEVSDHFLIAKHYVWSWRCLLDSLSLLGSKLFVDVSIYFQNFHLLKAGRVYEIGILINKCNQPLHIKGLMKVATVILYLSLYLHWIACFWKYQCGVTGPVVY